MISNGALNIQEIPLGDSCLKDFARFPWSLYRGDRLWTPPLMGDLLGNRLLGLVGLLTPRHPYHQHACDDNHHNTAHDCDQRQPPVHGFAQRHADALPGVRLLEFHRCRRGVPERDDGRFKLRIQQPHKN